MLVLEAKLFAAGLAAVLVGTAGDIAVHLAGWHAAERPVHVAVLISMVLVLSAVLLRALRPLITHRKERLHAHR